MLPARAFWFLRHGETDWNAQGLAQGDRDIPLNPRGVAQAREAAVALRGRGIRSIVASPLSRAADTAAVVANALDLPVATEPDLREVAFGDQEGLPMGPWYYDWLAAAYTPAGGESFAQLRTRGAAALARALAHEPPVLVVAHGALFRALRAEMGLDPKIPTPNALPLFCEPGTPWTLTAIGDYPNA